MHVPSRIKSCARCRRQKLRCDLYQRPGQPCSRCKRLCVDCSITAEPRQVVHVRRRASLDPQSGLVHHSPAPSDDQTTVTTSGHVSTSTPTGESTGNDSSMPPQVGKDKSLSHILSQANVLKSQVDECFSRFFKHYSNFLPGIFVNAEQCPEPYFEESPFLFWAITATGARHLDRESKLYRLAAQEIRGPTFQSLLNVTNPVPIIQGCLILCLWPLPLDTMWKDTSHVFAGAAHALAVQNGLSVTGHEQDFARTRSSSTREMRDLRAHLWLNCCLTFQTTSLCDGLPYFSIAGTSLSRKPCGIEAMDHSFQYLYSCHNILTEATRAFAEVINDDGRGGKSLLSLIKLFDTQILNLSAPPDKDYCYLTRCCTRLAISAYHFFIHPTDLKTAGLLSTFSIATEVLDVTSRLDAVGDFALYASNYYLRMTLLAAFCILRMVRSQLRETIDLRDAEQSLFKAISFAKRRSMQQGDLDERYGTIISQLWANSSTLQASTINGLDLRIRSRLFMSVVFDSLWWWRVECNGQGSPYDAETSQAQALVTQATDDAQWDPIAASDIEVTGPMDFVETCIDWNFPLNLDFLST